MSAHYTGEMLAAAVQALIDELPMNCTGGCAHEPVATQAARAVLDTVTPAIVGKALKEEASPIVIDSRDQGLGLGAAQRAIWRRADEIEGGAA